LDYPVNVRESRAWDLNKAPKRKDTGSILGTKNLTTERLKSPQFPFHINELFAFGEPWKYVRTKNGPVRLAGWDRPGKNKEDEERKKEKAKEFPLLQLLSSSISSDHSS
jgi:hypothetical protein